LTSATDFAAAGVQVGDIVEVADAGSAGDNGFYVVAAVVTTVITIDRDWPTGSLAALDCSVWAAKKEAGTDGVTSAASTRQFTSAASTFTSSGAVGNGVAAGDLLVISDPTTADDDGVYLISSVDSATQVTVDRDWPVGSNTSLDFTIYSRNGTSTVSLASAADGVTSVPATRELTSAGSTFISSGVLAGDLLVINDTGTPADNGIYNIASVDLETQLTVDRNFPTGSGAALDFVVYSRGRDGDTSVAGTFSSAGATFQAHGVAVGDILRISDAVDTGNNGDYMVLTVPSETSVTVNKATWDGGALTGLTFEILPGSVTFQGESKGTFFEGMRLTPFRNAGDTTNFDLEVKNSTNTLQLEKIFNLDRSNVVAQMAADSTLFTAVVRTGRGEPVPGKTFTVSGGDDGYTGIVDGDYIGNVATGTGLKAFRNAELIDINLVAVPGVATENVQNELIDLCDAGTGRGDCMALLDPPDSPTVATVQNVLDFTNGTLVRSTALNSSYAAIYWTWQQVFDEFNDTDVWTAPSGHIAAVYAHNDNVQAPWFAPAGLKRGKVVGSTDVRLSPDQDQRDSLQGPGQCVNPIVNFVGEGIFVFGQKTTQRATTALDRVNVRRMLLYVEKIIATAARQLIFDPNDEVLEREFEQLAEPVLRDVLSRRGIQEFRIVAATTAADRDNNKAVFQMFIKPTKAAEIIELQFMLTSQGANFQELVA
jgi:phage tail sheath protein FI